MSAWFDALNDDHIAMIAAQAVFFVATAAEDARINLSPKGLDSFRVLNPNRVAYLDLAGSGNETHAHLEADGRITIMLCNFQQPAHPSALRPWARRAAAGWGLERTGRPLHSASRNPTDIRHRGRQHPDLMRLGRARDDA